MTNGWNERNHKYKKKVKIHNPNKEKVITAERIKITLYEYFWKALNREYTSSQNVSSLEIFTTVKCYVNTSSVLISRSIYKPFWKFL